MHIHILGICGTFMGGIAALAKSNGHKVTGCDQNVYPPMSAQLENLGIQITEGYSLSKHLHKPDMYIIGNIISRGNELMEMILNKNLSYTSGPQWLYENILINKWVLAVAGTHGKTTTTAMLSWILESCGLAPGFLIGGIPNNFEFSARHPKKNNKNLPSFFVIEADEYDTAFFDKRSKFAHYHPRTLILNNLEFDHADIFDDITHIEKHFHHLIRTVPSEGKLLVNSESPVLSNLIKQGCWSEIEYFGKNSQWEYEKVNDDASSFKIYLDKKKQGTVSWKLMGHHNLMNALAAIAAARHVGITPVDSIKSLNKFKGVKRRMELIYSSNDIELFDDYAHHPSAIKTTLDGLTKNIKDGRIIAVIEPRSNTMKIGTMKKDLIESLKDADFVFCYAKNLSWDPKELFSKQRNIKVFEDLKLLSEAIIKETKPRDRIIFMSNGNFSVLQKKVINFLRDL